MMWKRAPYTYKGHIQLFTYVEYLHRIHGDWENDRLNIWIASHVQFMIVGVSLLSDYVIRYNVKSGPSHQSRRPEAHAILYKWSKRAREYTPTSYILPSSSCPWEEVNRRDVREFRICARWMALVFDFSFCLVYGLNWKQMLNRRFRSGPFWRWSHDQLHHSLYR